MALINHLIYKDRGEEIKILCFSENIYIDEREAKSGHACWHLLVF